MVYATPYNFMGRVLYEGLDKAYLVPEAVEKLKKANELLRKERLPSANCRTVSCCARS